jgi:hypothetical protein
MGEFRDINLGSRLFFKKQKMKILLLSYWVKTLIKLVF